MQSKLKLVLITLSTIFLCSGVASAANFSASPLSGDIPLTVEFTDLSINATSWQWNFGDGSENSTEQNPAHTYTEEGTYTVVLTATDGNLTDTEIKENYITVSAPVEFIADFSANITSGNAPLTVSFTDSSTNATSWQWNFGDGSENSTEQNPSHTYTEEGTYTVVLTATDGNLTDTEIKENYITVSAPVEFIADFSANITSGNAPLTVSFTDSSTNATSWQWNFGDGSENSTEQNPSHTYTEEGTYNVVLTATDGNLTDTETKEDYITIALTSEEPVADFDTNVTSGAVPLSVEFTDKSTDATSWEWDFGDDSENSTEQNPSHTYTQEGTYNVTLKAINDNGFDIATKSITVNSKTYVSGDRIWDAGANQSLDYTWTALSYSGFYYDLDTGEGSETMTVHLDSRSDRSIDRGDLEYETTPIITDFEYRNWGKYQVIGFMAEKYFAGYLDTTRFADEISVMSDGLLAKVLLDESDKRSLYAGSSLTLEQGYALNIVEVDVNGNNVYVTLSKDGSQVDETIVRDNGTYVYEADLGDSDDVPIIAVHFGNVFLGTEASAVFVDAIFQISDEYISVDSGDSYGVMEVQTVSDEKITMENDDPISLNRGKVTNIMGKLKFIVADDSTLRFAPFVDMSEAGTYELRGTVSEGEAFEWTPLNFEGFYYNIDEGIGTEKLEITELSGRTINDGDLVYTSIPEIVSFEYDDWRGFEVIGFMADKYFAGYPENEFTDEISLVSQGQLSKVLLDKSDKTSLFSGSSLVLEEGYTLNIVEVDVNGNSVYIRLTKDGDQIDDDIVGSDGTYVYKMDVGDVDDVPVIAVHFQDVFQGTESSAVFIDGIFQISDDYVSVESGETFGEMEVTGISENGITMKNEDSISLSRGREVSVMGDIKFKVADDSTVRFYPFVEVQTSASESLSIDNNEVVAQGTAMTITVTSRGMAVSNTTLKIDSKSIGSTSDEGTLRYTPDQIGNFTITAEKDGYVSATSKLEVISAQDETRKMTIDVIPEEVFEGATVEFRVLRAIGGEPVEGAEVAFDGRPIGNTSMDGNITYTATEVGMHKLTVSKSGLLDAELNFEVKELAARFTFTNLQISPLEVRAGDEATISVDVSNIGTAPGNYTAELKINGTTVDSQVVTLDNGNSTTLQFVHVEEEPGTYIVSVQGLSITYEVLERSGTIWYILGGILLLAAAGVGYLFTAGGWTVEMAKAKIDEFIGSIR